MKMWGGRFEKEPEGGLLSFTSSLGFDVRLYSYDIRCTGAWTLALAHASVLTTEEEIAITKALEQAGEELEAGSFEFLPTDEDIHTAIERRVEEIVGPAGGKIRTGRSRNDQIATDMRLFAMEHCGNIVALIRLLQKVLLEKARETSDLPVPGHTHLQQAQPVLLAHLLLAFVYMLERDVKRLQSARDGADSMPLGSGALAGTTVAVDREELAFLCGFSRPSQNSADAVSDRDFVCEMLFALSVIMVHLSRLSEQIILWCSTEFGLAELDDAWATGSSLMPQKKNPDGPELVRGKTGRVIGSLVSILTVLKALPLTYNRDLQEDKEPLFDAADTVIGCLRLLEGTVSTMKFNRERADELLVCSFTTATDLADFLVDKGMEFPRAHEVVGELVSFCIKEGKAIDELPLAELTRFSELFDEDAYGRLSVEASLARRGSQGGSSPGAVSRQIADAERMISGREGPL
jgi:argininosuccinate lyase